MLEHAIRSIRSEVDYVNVVWQSVSWFGNLAAPSLEQDLLELKEKGLIDELIFFQPDLSAKPDVNESHKRNIGLNAARKAGCTHFITLDTDELFDSEEFKKAKKIIYEHNLTHTACNIITYITPTLRELDFAEFAVPFIHKIANGEQLVLNADGVWYTDPTRKIPLGQKSRPYLLSIIKMHHFPYIRKDMKNKLYNSSACLSEEHTQKLKEKYLDLNIQKGIQDGILVPCKDKFSLSEAVTKSIRQL